MFTNCMIDLETLGTSPDSVILSIAAVLFNPFEITKDTSTLPGIQLLLDIEEQEKLGRTIDEDTVLWWTTQPQSVQDVIFAENGRLPVSDALTQLTKFCWNKSRVWVQGPDFDIALLNHIYKQTNVARAWKYWQARDSRTLLDFTPVEQPPVTHNSIEDCRRQIIGVQTALHQLKITNFVR